MPLGCSVISTVENQTRTLKAGGSIPPPRLRSRTSAFMLARQPASFMFELRAAWASGRRVALSLDERCRTRRVEGHVTRCSATGAFVVVAGWHVPADAILAVHRPSRLGDSSYRGGEWSGPPRRVAPQVEELPLSPSVAERGGTVLGADRHQCP